MLMGSSEIRIVFAIFRCCGGKEIFQIILRFIKLCGIAERSWNWIFILVVRSLFVFIFNLHKLFVFLGNFFFNFRVHSDYFGINSWYRNSKRPKLSKNSFGHRNASRVPFVKVAECTNAAARWCNGMPAKSKAQQHWISISCLSLKFYE